MKYQASRILSAMIVLLLGLSVSISQAQTQQQTLNQYVADLQKNPNDYALREKIVRHVQTMKPSPAVPEEARRHYVMAKTLSDEAKKVEDFNDAIAEFRGALLVAPWWAEANRDFGLTLEAAQRYDEAITYIKLYMATNPGSDRTRAAQDEIYKIEAKKKLAGKASKESSPAVVSAQKQDPFEDWLKKIDGRRYTYRNSDESITQILDVKGRTLIEGFNVDPGSPVHGPRGYSEHARYEIRGRVVEGPVRYTSAGIKSSQTVFTISENGEKIHQEFRLGVGKGREYDYYWQR